MRGAFSRVSLPQTLETAVKEEVLRAQKWLEVTLEQEKQMKMLKELPDRAGDVQPAQERSRRPGVQTHPPAGLLWPQGGGSNNSFHLYSTSQCEWDSSLNHPMCDIFHGDARQPF